MRPGGCRSSWPGPGSSSPGATLALEGGDVPAPLSGGPRGPPRPLRPPRVHGAGRGWVVGTTPSCFSVRSFVASSEDRARLPRGLPATMRTRSWLFIRLYLFSDLLTNCGQRRGGGGRRNPGSGDLHSDPGSAPGAWVSHAPSQHRGHLAGGASSSAVWAPSVDKEANRCSHCLPRLGVSCQRAGPKQALNGAPLQSHPHLGDPRAL